jgi:hypothetical protein
VPGRLLDPSAPGRWRDGQKGLALPEDKTKALGKLILHNKTAPMRRRIFHFRASLRSREEHCANDVNRTSVSALATLLCLSYPFGSEMTGGPTAIPVGPETRRIVISDLERQLRGTTGKALLCLLATTFVGPAMQAQTSDESSTAAQAQRDEQINRLQKRLEEMQGELDALKKANSTDRADQHYSTSKASAPHPGRSLRRRPRQNLRIQIARTRSRLPSLTSLG